MGWRLVIGTLHYRSVKTDSAYVAVLEGVIISILGFLVYGYFIRFTITLAKHHMIVVNAGRPAPFHWPSLVAVLFVLWGVRVLIERFPIRLHFCGGWRSRVRPMV